ncbi:hypothetical protein HDU87_003226 [Geranomyces variabilis]|uniref:CsbD-like domain-containing protein n=1 Tax=Geranomyces variabilis TaxID=109894 RepID=A0AAD5TK51_9FUNG|nr:hypothetical protein HDU87_003226 [Geranomyces variabilis]
MTSSTLTGHLNAAKGAVKETVGSATGNHSLHAKGVAEKAEGHAQVNAAKAGNHVDAAGDKTAGNIKKNVGNALGNERMQTEGGATEAKGHVKSHLTTH